MCPMETNKFSNINITHAIPISHEKRFFAYIALYTLDPTSSHSIQACIHYRNLPRLTILIMNDCFVFSTGKIKRNIAVMQKIIRKPLLNNMLLVSCTNHKLVKSIKRIFLHYMPQYRFTTNFNHRLRFKLAFFRNSRSKPTSQNNYFHKLYHPYYPLYCLFIHLI